MLISVVNQDVCIDKISWDKIEIYNDDEDDVSLRFTPFTQEFSDSIAFSNSSITISSINNTPPKTYTSSNKYFTVGDLLNIIIDYEYLDRPNSEWFGGIDVHHIYFEGLGKQPDGTYQIYWGS